MLFTSAAAGGKGSGAVSGQLEAVAEYTGSDWKLTLLDGSRSFTATAQLSGAVAPGAQVAVSYSGAGSGGQEYVSAAILDSGGNWLYYGAIAQNSASGTASVTVPEDLAAGSYTLAGGSPSSAGGDGLTDLASGFSDFELTVVHVHHARKVEAVAPTTTAEGNREYWYCDGCGGCFADEACTFPSPGRRSSAQAPYGGDGGQSSGGQAAARQPPPPPPRRRSPPRPPARPR